MDLYYHPHIFPFILMCSGILSYHFSGLLRIKQRKLFVATVIISFAVIPFLVAVFLAFLYINIRILIDYPF